MAQNVVVTLDLGKDADLGRLQLFFNGATSASPDTINGTGLYSMRSIIVSSPHHDTVLDQSI